MFSIQKKCKKKELQKGKKFGFSGYLKILNEYSFRDDADNFDYIKEEVGFRLSDRLFDIKKEFQNGVDYGGGESKIIP